MDKIPFVDAQGLAGAWTLGTVQTGEFDLTHRVSLPGGFGDISMEANRHLVGDGWRQEVGHVEDWTPMHGVGYVCGTPPCSGFSLLNTSKGKNARGAGSAINSCMKELVTYGGLCVGLDGKQGAEVVAFESVQGAFKQGYEWMKELRSILEEVSGQQYDLTHVLMSGSSVGSAQMRHRYYWVAHRIPLTVTNPERRKVITYEDAIGDLVGAKTQWERQPYPTDAFTDFQRKLRSSDGQFDCHQDARTGAFVRLVDELSPHWQPGEDVAKAVHRYGRRPKSIKPEKFLGLTMPNGERRKEPLKGWSWPTRVHPDRPGYVLTGGGILSFVHWKEDRLLTVREASRLMGYPDSWRWDYVNSPMQASLLIGKCCPVQSGSWISQHVANSIRQQYSDDSPTLARNAAQGDVEQIGDREFKHDSTNLYRQWRKEDELNGK